jgi:hypothetical protein
MEVMFITSYFIILVDLFRSKYGLKRGTGLISNKDSSFDFSLSLLVFFITHVLTYLLTYLLIYLLTPWSRVLLEKISGLQLVKKFPAFYGTEGFITAFTSARHLPMS